MKAVKTLIILTFILAGKHFAIAQQGNVWAFGLYSGLDFNTVPPKVITTASHGYNPQAVHPNDSIGWPGYSSSISDCQGRLLFYCTGQYVWNRYNQIMPHGVFNDTKKDQTYDPAIIAQVPGDSFRYYIFHGNGYYLYYAIIDMRLDSGRGDIDLNYLSVPLYNSTGGVRCCTIRMPNDTDFWLLTLKTVDTLYAYPVKNTGIGSPKKQPIASISGNSRSFFLKPDNKGDKLTITGQDAITATTGTNVRMYNFNNSLGVISGAKNFYNGGLVTPESLEFSPSDSFIYIGNGVSGYYPGVYPFLVQFETYNPRIDTTEIVLTTTRANKTLPKSAFLQLAPDNKIYVNDDSSSYYFSVINAPDKKGTACEYQKNVISFAPHLVGEQMPTLSFPIRKLKWIAKSGCSDSIHFTNLSDTIYFKSFKWYFGDGDSSSKYTPWHSYKKQGKYNVLLVGVNGCGAKLYFSDSVDVYLPAHAGFKKDTVTYTCQQAKLTLHNTYKDLTQTYIYDYGDSTAKTGLLTHTYTKAGSYLVTQAVSNGHCQDTLRQTISIKIEPRPKSGFSIANTAQCQPYHLQIKNTSNNAHKYLWQTPSSKGLITDTTTKATSVASFLVSADSGYHEISLVASNHQGCSDTFTMPKAVYVSQPPSPSFTYTQKILCGAIETDFKNASKFSTKYQWLFTDSFGNTVADTAASPVHKFTKSGTYQVWIIAQNSYCQDTVKQDIKINIPTIKANFTTKDLKGCPGLKVNFTNQSTYGGQLYKNVNAHVGFEWDFGDTGSATNTDTSAVPSHVYQKAGIYTVRLIATSPQGCQDTFFQKNYIHVLPYPKAALAIQDSTVLCAAFRYSFKNLSANADSFIWDFGDGLKLIVENDNTVTHTYKTTGDYKVTVTAGNGFCLDSANINIGIKLRPQPSPDFTADSVTVCLGKPISFKNNSSDADSVLWSYGDGSQKDTSQNPTHLYAKPGEYNVSLIAKSKEGCIITLQKTAFVQVADTFNAHILPAYSEGCAPLSVQFIAPTVSKDLPLLYFWDFGDKTSSTAQNPAHVFQKNGVFTYKVKLVVTNKYCSDSAVGEVRVKNLDATKDTVIMRLATVDNDAYAHIFWQKNPLAVNYELFRSKDGNTYEPVNFTSDTEYIDHKVNVHGQEYWYKVTGLDACGGTSAISREATTIFLNGKSANDDAVCNLTWNNYQHFRYGLKDYEVIKDHAPQSPVVVNIYTDPGFFSETVTGHEYQVVASENSGGSSDTLKSYSNIVNVPLQARLWIPNVFSPNGDGFNDSFYVRATGIAAYHITIYNRWGERVFESTDIHQKLFDKSGSGNQEGVYLYMIEALTATGDWIYRKGTVTVIK